MIAELKGPQLSFDNESDRWVLTLQRRPVYVDDCLQCYIRCAWQGHEAGWFEYRFIRRDEGDWTELVTQAEFEARVSAIEENEGDEIARLWAINQQEVDVVFDGHPVFALRDHWEAMMMLGLFSPHVNLKSWALSKPLSPAVEKQIEEIRNRQMSETAAEMSLDAEPHAWQANR